MLFYRQMKWRMSRRLICWKRNRQHRLFLLVEDNEELLALMVRLLHGKYHILKAANGTEALEILAKQEVDLIVSDVMMPEMDGMELCRRVKTQFETCHIPLILLTAKTSDEDHVEGYESGADGYICKPLRLSVLFAKIDNLLKRRKRMGVDFRKQLVFEAKELNYTSMDEAFIRKAVDCVNAHLSDCDFEHAQFMAEMGMARTTLADKLKLLTGLTPLCIYQQCPFASGLSADRREKENPYSRFGVCRRFQRP